MTSLQILYVINILYRVIHNFLAVFICPEHPAPPTLREPITTTPSTVTLEVDHRNTCFVNCTFQYEVKVHPAGSPMSTSTTNHSTNVFSMSGLSGGTRYRAEIIAVCSENSTIRSDSLNINFTTGMEDDLSMFVVMKTWCYHRYYNLFTSSHLLVYHLIYQLTLCLY